MKATFSGCCSPKTRSALFKARQKKVGEYIHFNLAASLVTIWALDGKATPAKLSRRLFLEPHSVSELVIRMEKKGLIKKKHDEKRENIVIRGAERTVKDVLARIIPGGA